MREIRKIQQVGHSTLVVTIPKKWADELELKPGLRVNLEKETDGSIRIRVEEAKKTRCSTCVINADKYDSPGMLIRTLTGIYLTGRNTIRVYSEKGLEADHLEQVRFAAQNLTGLGIIEQTVKDIVIHDILDAAKFPFENLIRHMFGIVSFMQETLLKTLEMGDAGLAAEVSNLEAEIDRVYWLAVRQLLLVVRESGVGEKIGISSLSDAVGYSVIVKCLEEIADHYEDIGKTVMNALEKGLRSDNRNRREIVGYFDQLHSMTDGVLQALLCSDGFKANDLINEIEDLLEEMYRSSKKLLEEGGEEPYSVDINSMLLSLIGATRQNRNILETVINQCMSECHGICEPEKTDVQPNLISP